jgi:hypothetical protein
MSFKPIKRPGKPVSRYGFPEEEATLQVMEGMRRGGCTCTPTVVVQPYYDDDDELVTSTIQVLHDSWCRRAPSNRKMN